MENQTIDKQMTKDLHADIKIHLDWLVKRLTDQGYELKQIIDLLKTELSTVRNNIIIDLSAKTNNIEIMDLTGYSNPTISTILTGYWSSKEIGFKEEKERNI